VLPLSGVLSFVFLILTKFAGLKEFVTASEIVFKVLYLIFLSSFFYSIAPRFMITKYPAREHIKWIIIFLFWIGIFFGVPLLYYGEKGTGFLMLIIFFLLTAHFTKDSRFFIAGIVLLGLLLSVACLASPDVKRRVLGAWLFYEDYINAPYYPGEKATPGRQLFTALASIKVSPFGLGLTRGVLTFFYKGKIQTLVPEAKHDFISIPLAMELGIAVIAIVCASYILMLKLVPVEQGKLTFRGILATCIAVSFACQGLYNISGSIGMVPMTGIPAPWLSYSGTAMIANYTLAAVLLSILNEKEIKAHAAK
jgi:cell division protein FtsW (lipid II flippase)